MEFNEEEGFEVLPGDEMADRHQLSAENRPTIVLDEKRVPDNLRHLIPLAEFWGVGDDLIREDLLSRASKEQLEQLKSAVSEADDELDDWLAGPEADGEDQSDEYLAFTAMRMAADSVD